MTAPTEVLKPIEQKDKPEEELNTTPPRFDRKHAEEILRMRFAKLERIKADIPIKTYQHLAEKLAGEKKFLHDMISEETAAARRDNTPQSLPKNYFEKHTMKPRLIKAL